VAVLGLVVSIFDLIFLTFNMKKKSQKKKTFDSLTFLHCHFMVIKKMKNANKNEETATT
jgi:hypothetical protein